MKAKKAELLAHYTSGDVSGYYSFAEGYAAVVFARTEASTVFMLKKYNPVCS